MSNIVLSHHGIPNMEWGHRRFQNPDGTLTPAGKIRYGKGGEKASSGKGGEKASSGKGGEKAKGAADRAFDQRIKVGKDKAPISTAEKVARDASSAVNEASKFAGGVSKLRGSKKRKAENEFLKNMTDDELKSSIERLRMEKAYRELASADIESGENHVKDLIDTIGAGVGVASSIISIIAAINAAKKG